jgi:glycosyltransferase involved in cell wall biosynthesis
VVQAWAQKTPLICSKSLGPLQYVRDGEDALMFDIDNVEQLTQRINQMIGDKDLSSRLVNSGYERYKNEFSKEKIVADYISFYQKIIQENLAGSQAS